MQDYQADRYDFMLKRELASRLQRSIRRKIFRTTLSHLGGVPTYNLPFVGPSFAIHRKEPDGSLRLVGIEGPVSRTQVAG